MHPRRRSLAGIAAAAVLLLLLPLSASAHSELKTSDPVDGASVPSPFSGPVVLTFSEALADGSKADLVGPDGSTVATAAIDATAATMTFSLASALAPGAYQVKWTSIAGDGDLLRGIVTFSVAAAAPSSTPEASTAPTNPPGAASTVGAATPAASPAASSDTGSGSGTGSDVILPIVIALIVAAAGAFYLFRRNRPA
jgi:methionine-rich copper-binding protein CopC